MEINNGNNLLICDQNEEIHEVLFKASIKIANHGHTVLYISSKPIEKLPDFANKNIEALKEIIFMYFKNRETLMQRLLDLHNWSKTPKLIILESLQQFFVQNSSDTSSVADVYDSYSIVMGTLHDCVRIFSDKLHCTILSIVTLDLDFTKSYNQNLLQILVDLYYYSDNCVSANDFESKIDTFLSL